MLYERRELTLALSVVYKSCPGRGIIKSALNRKEFARTSANHTRRDFAKEIVMTKITFITAVLIIITLGFPAHKLIQKNRALAHQLEQKDKQLSQVQVELMQVKHLLETSEQKLGYLAAHKTPVQVTAFCKQPHSNRFANGHSVTKAYAVKKRTLPEDVIVNVALSPTTQRKLNARMGDLIVIMDKRGHRKTVARFVDTTFAGESRAVIDVYFADPENARHWGRKDGYYAVNISGKASPFRVN